MLPIKLKKLTLPLCLCAISVLFTPSVVSAEETGPIAASKAADQRAALAKKAAEREAKKAAEAKNAAEAQQPATEQQANETPTPAEEPKGN
ncbi:MAG: hypothetical protein NTV43_03520 [Methylococcales bacterium]|nr:hypothetical protein [Methylococcales bacterium]